MKKLVLLFVFAVASLATYAAVGDEFNDATSGLNFKVLSESPYTVEVASNTSFAGVATIPAIVTYGEQVYNVVAIADRAFVMSGSVTGVVIPTSVVTIGANAFSDCHQIATIDIPSSVSTIGLRAFQNCAALTAINVDAANTKYKSDAGVLFNHAGDTLIQYPKGKADASYTIPATVTTINEAAFAYASSFQTVVFPASVVTIEKDAFMKCNGLQTLKTTDSLTTIGDKAFGNCSALTSVELGSAIDSIGEKAFYFSSRITEIISHIENPAVVRLGEKVFSGVSKTNCTLKVPTEKVADYQAAAQWSDFVNIVEISTTGTIAVEAVNSISTYPNPVADILNVKVADSLVGQRMIITNISGAVVYSSVVNDSHLSISLSDLSGGIYFVKVGNSIEQIIKR